MKKSAIITMLSGISSNYVNNFTEDGSLISLSGSGTATVSGGAVVITPTLGDNLFTDGGLEGTYTDGLNTSLTKSGSPTVSESSDVHGGSKAQAFQATVKADRLRQSIAVTSGNIYIAKIYGKRLSGTSGQVRFEAPTNADFVVPYLFYNKNYYKKYAVPYLADTTANKSTYVSYDNSVSDFDSVVVDDVEFRQITLSTCFQLRNTGMKVHSVGCVPFTSNKEFIGCVANADSITNPQSFVIALIDKNSILLYKVVSGVWTNLIKSTATSRVAHATLKIENTGTVYKLYYNGTQVGTDQTITDVEIINNKYAGLFSTSERAEFLSFGYAANKSQISLSKQRGITITNDGNYNAFPHIIKLASGNLMMVYRKASAHVDGTDGIIIKKISTDLGVTWGSEITIATDDTYDLRDPGIVQISGGNILLTFQRYSTATGNVDIQAKISTDDGDTWDDAATITTGFTGYTVTAAPACELTNGNLIMPYYGIDTGDTYRSSRCSISTDGGVTWGSEVVIGDGETAEFHYVEPEIIELSENNLLCLIRSSGSDGYIKASFSTDNGATWSDPTSASKFVGSGVPHMIKLASGNVVCTTRGGITVGQVLMYYSPDSGVNWTDSTDRYVIDNSSQAMEYACPVEVEAGKTGVVYSLEQSASRADIVFTIIDEDRLDR